jgi:hypothetical protein
MIHSLGFTCGTSSTDPLPKPSADVIIEKIFEVVGLLAKYRPKK